MNATCPQCAEADQTVAVPRALTDADRPLDQPTRALLSAPSEPAGTSGAAITLFILAGLLALLGLRGLLSHDDRAGSDAAYQAGYNLGPFLFATILLTIGFVVHAVSRRRRLRTAGPQRQPREQYQQLRRLWRAAWLCHRCQVAFLPAASIQPGFPDSPPIPVAQFPQWLAATAERTVGTGTPSS
ncbi:hypothetical protein [Kitasatospora sp. NPDC047058]|uniref:hypothetical protein n=1 Tax=Kitasatospora sp. NPDC047058 TaxID=3155620 RepID=UPI0033D6CFDE